MWADPKPRFTRSQATALPAAPPGGSDDPAAVVAAGPPLDGDPDDLTASADARAGRLDVTARANPPLPRSARNVRSSSGCQASTSILRARDLHPTGSTTTVPGRRFANRRLRTRR